MAITYFMFLIFGVLTSAIAWVDFPSAGRRSGKAK